MKCPKCQFENPEGFKFCGNCTHPLQASAIPTTPSIDLSQPHSYTPKFLADKILTFPKRHRRRTQAGDGSVCDVAGFTSMSEKLDPEQVHQIMDGCSKF